MNLVLRTLHLLLPLLLAVVLLYGLLRWSWVQRSVWRLAPALAVLLVGYTAFHVWWVVR